MKKKTWKRIMLSMLFLLAAFFAVNHRTVTAQAASKMSVSAIKKSIKKIYKKPDGSVKRYVTKITAKKIKNSKKYHYKVTVRYVQGDGALTDIYYVNAKTRKAKVKEAFGGTKTVRLK